MAIVDTVWGRLTRCNPPDPGSLGGEARKRRPLPLLPAIAALRWIVVWRGASR